MDSYLSHWRTTLWHNIAQRRVMGCYLGVCVVNQRAGTYKRWKAAGRMKVEEIIL